MFSKPLAYPSTLDRPSAGCAYRADVVLRGGDLEPDPRTARTFLSQAGPRFDLELVQAEHHLSVPFLRFAFKTKKATHWVALARSCYAASFLAHPPLDEG
jgi:hypothetical protein